MKMKEIWGKSGLGMRFLGYLTILIVQFHGYQGCSQQYPFLTDPGSEAGSATAIPLYEMLEVSDRALKMELNKFNRDYGKRLVYLNAMSSFLSSEIEKGIDEAFGRFLTLKEQNQRLSVFNHGRKKRNNRTLHMVQVMLDNVKKELKGQGRANVLGGEKLNLYQNTMGSLAEIHRVLDRVEDNMKQSFIMDLLMKKLKS